MSSQGTTTLPLPDTEPYSFVDLPAELRNCIYHYTFTTALGHLELFDLLEPIPGEALLRTYPLEDVRSAKFADDIGRIRHVQANSRRSQAMYDKARAQIDWRSRMFWLNPNSPQFDAFEGHAKLKKIVNAIEALNANELRQVQYVSIPSPVLIPDGKERYFYSDGIWECLTRIPSP
jgi:hypothetical protein